MTQCASSPQDVATDACGLTRKLIRFIRLIRGYWFSMTLGQIDEPRCHISSHIWPAIVLQCDISTRTMIDVSDRIADNRNGQFEFEPS